MNWAGKFGAILMAIGGFVKLFVPAGYHDVIDSIINGIITIGGGLLGYDLVTTAKAVRSEVQRNTETQEQIYVARVSEKK